MDLEYAQGWRPEEGDTLVGTVTTVDVGYSEYRGQYPIVTVRPEGGGDEVAVHCFHDALFNRMMTIRPQVGERIGIQYKGKRPSKQNPRNTVAVYVARVEGRTGDAWAAMDGTAAGRATSRTQGPSAPATDIPVDAADFSLREADPDDDIPF